MVFYIYDNRVVKYAKELKPSPRGELEIVDINNRYLKNGELMSTVLDGEWIDAGTFESLHKASVIAREHKLGIKNHGSNIQVTLKKVEELNKELI